MTISQTVTNEGRQALIEYLRNSAVGIQTKKILLNNFRLIKSESASATQTKTLAELNPNMLIGKTGSGGTLTVPAVFEITAKNNEAGNKLQTVMSVPIAFSTGDDPANNITAVAICFETDETDAITAVSTVSKRFTIAGSSASKYATNSVIAVQGSTANDAEYTVASVSEAGGNTLIVVNETVASAVADGVISKQYLMAYTVYAESFNKAASSDLTIRTNIQF